MHPRLLSRCRRQSTCCLAQTGRAHVEGQVAAAVLVQVGELSPQLQHLAAVEGRLLDEAPQLLARQPHQRVRRGRRACVVNIAALRTEAYKKLLFQTDKRQTTEPGWTVVPIKGVAHPYSTTERRAGCLQVC